MLGLEASYQPSVVAMYLYALLSQLLLVSGQNEGKSSRSNDKVPAILSLASFPITNSTA